MLFAAEQPSPSSLLFDDKKIPQRVKKLSHLECSLPPSPDCLVLPEDVVDKIAELDLELSEGDITQKGNQCKPNNTVVIFLREGYIKQKVINGIRMTAAVIYL